MYKMKRRDFLKQSIGVSLSLMLSVNSRVLGANDQIRFGIIGVGKKGVEHANHLCKLKGVQLVAMADPDPVYQMEKLKTDLKNQEVPIHVDTYTDFRKLLDRKDVDAVIIASCNHWHALHGIYALQAGKHVYIEKPISHNVWEGRQLVNLANQSKRIVQSGLQHRSRNCWPEVMDYIREGHLGKVLCARGLCYKRRDSIGKAVNPVMPPETCDYDLWLGPAEKIPMMRPTFHYDWHWVWNTGNGDIANQGVHQLDIARWLIGQNTYPQHILSVGGRFGYEDAGQTPNTLISFFDYKPVPLIFEVRGLPMSPKINAMDRYKKTRIGTILECEGGYISEAAAYDNDHKRICQFTGHGGEKHLPKFINAVKNQDTKAVGCSLEDGHLSSAISHFANISYRIGKTENPEHIKNEMQKKSRASEAWDRFQEHLEKNQVDLDKHLPILGAELEIDPDTESVIGTHQKAASPLLTREYRKPWVVPEMSFPV